MGDKTFLLDGFIDDELMGLKNFPEDEFEFSDSYSDDDYENWSDEDYILLTDEDEYWESIEELYDDEIDYAG